MNDMTAAPRLLGFAGLLPQGACLLAVLLGGPEWRFAALGIAWAYAALIFSFLGGLWWGLAAASAVRGGDMDAADAHSEPSWIYVAAVLPSLIALVTFLPWIWGMAWPGPSLLLLGICLAASPLIDVKLGGITPHWWMSLRWSLSLGLGGLTLVLGFLASA